jgi:hypothetical protein
MMPMMGTGQCLRRPIGRLTASGVIGQESLANKKA